MSQRGTSYLPVVILAALLGSGLVALACDTGQKSQEAPKPTPSPRIVKPVTDDGEVFYFPVIGDDYRASLSAFRKAHPELRCRYFGADEVVSDPGSRYAYSHIVGHTVVCTDLATNAQEETVL